MGFIEFNDGRLGPVEEVTPEFWDHIQQLTEQIRTVHVGPYAEVVARRDQVESDRHLAERVGALEDRLDTYYAANPLIVRPTPEEQLAVLQEQFRKLHPRQGTAMLGNRRLR